MDLVHKICDLRKDSKVQELYMLKSGPFFSIFICGKVLDLKCSLKWNDSNKKSCVSSGI